MERFSIVARATGGAVLAALLFAYPAFFQISLQAQQAPSVAAWKGRLSGPSSSGPLAGVTVVLSSGQNRFEATAGPDGSFAFSSVAPGTYRVTLLRDGQALGQPQSLTLAEHMATLSLTFPGEALLSIAGEGTATAKSGGEALSSAAVSELPLNKRDFSQLLLLAAGTMTDVNGATNFTQQFAINGQRGVEATFAMDGSDTSDPEMARSHILQLQRRCGGGD